MSQSEDLPSRFPLHWPVWHNDYESLRAALGKEDIDTEQLDPRGRTVLHLAVSLGHLECARLLLHHGANVLTENKAGWSVLHEAISTGDPEMVCLILQYRDYRQACVRLQGVPRLLSNLQNSPDFYVEMKWEFNSWVPLLSKVCPSDVCKIWKKGTCLRVDSTLDGFENMSWKRGNRSFVFTGSDQGATLLNIDHDACEVIREILYDNTTLRLDSFMPEPDVVVHRLTHPVVCTHLNVDSIRLEQSTQGYFGWKSDRVETVNGFKSAVFSASNVEIVSKSRSEHVDDKAQKTSENSSFASRFLKSFSGFGLDHNASSSTSDSGDLRSSCNPEGLSAVDYFGKSLDVGDIGRPRELSVKTQKFKGSIWISDDYPLSLCEQVLPIIDLMSTTSPHFAKLGDFIKLKLPAGFPVKIEIPVFHVLNACVTFDCVNGIKNGEPVDVPFVTTAVGPRSSGGESKPALQPSVTVDSRCFDVPTGYKVFSVSEKVQTTMEEENDRLLQLAIQESLRLTDDEDCDEQVTLLEALSNTSPSESRRAHQVMEPRGAAITGSYHDELETVLKLSSVEAEQHRQQQMEEDEELRRAIELSMLEQ